jgi:hypothetical protein
VSGRGLDAILAELRPALRSCIAALAESLLGQPTIRRKRELRWGAKGSFRVIISGPKQGACCNFDSGWKGDPLRLIENERHTDFIGAVKYGCDYVGIAFDPDAVAEAIRWQIAEGQLVQIIGRARGVNRTEDNPVDILVMTNAPLPIPVERLISAADLDPSPADLMMAAGGVSFESPTDAATAYPQLWPTRNAAKKAMEKHREGILGSNRNKEYLITVRPQDRREAPSHVRVDYQLPGHGKRLSTAWVDPHLVSDPEAWLTKRLGPLTNFALDPANQEVCCGAIAPRNPPSSSSRG